MSHFHKMNNFAAFGETTTKAITREAGSKKSRALK